MQKPEKQATDRRKDYAQRLRVAVRKAHDPLFSLLKTPPEDKAERPETPLVGKLRPEPRE
ncbi:MAG TPA: hypothetical protein VD965_10830 [Burkholderiales bacterium]|nr:hypothetical protein [Burkholderiales bacterium]